MSENGRLLSPRKQRAIAALMSAPTLREASAVAGVGERTLYRWLTDDPHFRQELARLESEAIEAATRRMAALQEKATAVIQQVMNDNSNQPGVRLRAALSVLDYMVRLHEISVIERRLSELERMVFNEHKE